MAEKQITNAPALSPLQKFNRIITADKTQEYIMTVLKDKKRVVSFVTALTSAVANSETLQACEPMSLMYTALKAATLNLAIDPSLGYAAMIPFKDGKSGKTFCQFQIQRDGWMELLMRTGQVKFVANEVVHEGELVKHNKFTGEYVFDEDAKKSDKVIGYMARMDLINGFSKTIFWTKEEVEAHAKRFSQAFRGGKSSPWQSDFDAMARKTVLKALFAKYAPKSVAIQQAIKFDQAVVKPNDSLTDEDLQIDTYDVDYMDNPDGTAFTEVTSEEVDPSKDLFGNENTEKPKAKK